MRGQDNTPLVITPSTESGKLSSYSQKELAGLNDDQEVGLIINCKKGICLAL
jgi:hypothetical protein